MVPKIGVAAGHLMFRLRDGSIISCECIGEPYASKIAALQDDTDRLISCLRNARGIMQDRGYLYVKEIDKLLSEFGVEQPRDVK